MSDKRLRGGVRERGERGSGQGSEMGSERERIGIVSVAR